MSDWPVMKLTDVVKFIGGTQPPKSSFIYEPKTGYVRLLQIRDFSSDEHVTYVEDSKKLRKCENDDVLIGRYGASVGKILRGKSGAINVAICKTVPNENALSKDFLYFFLQTETFQNKIVGFGEGRAVQAGFNKNDLSQIEIPLPLIDEQRRIVARIEELTCRAEEARKLAVQREAELDALLKALYSRMIEGVEWMPLEEVASLVRRAVKTKPDGRYEEMGIRSFGKGTFQKPVLTGKQIGNKRIYTIHEGDLVFNNVFAWERAIAVAKPEDHGRVGSHRFITYVPHEGKATSEFLCHHFLAERGIEDIRAASPGSAGRNRTLGLTKLERILVPVPAFDEQKRFAEIAKRRQHIRRETAGIEKDIKAFNAALLAKAFRGEL